MSLLQVRNLKKHFPIRTGVFKRTTGYVYAVDDYFHTFHIHGHRWVPPVGGPTVDNVTLGPGDVITSRFTEDNPGRWLYHCHVWSHIVAGLSGWYVVE